MGIWDSFKGVFVKATEPQAKIVDNVTSPNLEGIFKAYIPEFLYNPPFGYPRKANLPLMRDLAATPYVFSVVKTLCDEASSLEYEIKIKGGIENPDKWKDKLKEIKTFFENPNGNEESWEHIQRCLFRDILEVDAGVVVKVFNKEGKMTQIFARDGSLFLYNPDIYGYLGNRDEFVMPFEQTNVPGISPQTDYQSAVTNYYQTYAMKAAAYFQYGWTAGSYPTPFGRREIIYMMANPRTDSIYGRSPVEILTDTIFTLYYGSKYHLDFYLNSNMPEGIIQIPGADEDELKSVQERFNNKVFNETDPLGNRSRIGHKVPVTSLKDVAFINFSIPPKEMQIIEQQEWFTKILWMSFGVTPDEMGYTENSNRAVSSEQTKVFKRKAIRPICNVMTYHVNTQLLPEFVVDEFGGDWETAQNECPFEYVYKDYDVEEDLKKHEILKREIDMGVKTPEMVAKDLKINVDELKKQKEENLKKQQDIFKQNNEQENNEQDIIPRTDEERAKIHKQKYGENSELPPRGSGREEKALTSNSPLSPKPFETDESDLSKEIITYIKDVGKSIEKLAKEEV